MLASTVRQRVREIGIRLALGAPTQGLWRMVMIEGLKPILIGAVPQDAEAIEFAIVAGGKIFGCHSADIF